MKTTSEFGRLCQGVKIKARRGARLAYEKQDNWQRNANDYRITLYYLGRQISVDFWQGTGIDHEPDVTNVLECLISDTIAGEVSFKEFCGDMGYSADSRDAFGIWQQCKRLGRRVHRLLGDDFDKFAYAAT